MVSLQYLEILVGYLVCAIVALFGVLLIWKIATNQIDLTMLLSDDNGKASTSRFQLVIFTFVVAFSFFLVVVSNVKLRQNGSSTDTEGLPDVPSGVLALLGISASSYLVSRGIQASEPDEDKTEIKTEIKTTEKK
jgi:hypothetical protein